MSARGGSHGRAATTLLIVRSSDLCAPDVGANRRGQSSRL